MAEVVKVIDVSHWQGDVDFAKVKGAGTLGVIVKATEGTSYVDSNLGANLANAASAGLVCSTYHYLSAGVDPAKQMDHYVATVTPSVGARMVIDFEDKGATLDELHKAVARLIEISEERALNLQITVYSGHTIKELLEDTSDVYLGNYTSLWIAQYTSASSPSWPSGTWPVWSLWQWSDKGTVAGVDGSVDCNRFNGSDENLVAWLGPASVPAPPVEDFTEVSLDITANKPVQLRVTASANVEVEGTSMKTLAAASEHASKAREKLKAKVGGAASDEHRMHDGGESEKAKKLREAAEKKAADDEKKAKAEAKPPAASTKSGAVGEAGNEAGEASGKAEVGSSSSTTSASKK